jgi:transglutaminase-like putative cysteine protease
MESEKMIENAEEMSIYDSAKQLRNQHEGTDAFVLAVGRFIVDHAHMLSEVYQPKSILESRFTPAVEAFEKGMLSCGAIFNISTEMLKSVGLQVKLIHGESATSVDHAWISVFDPETNSWIEYDLTEDDGRVPSTNVKKFESDSWEEIKGQIEADHSTYKQRMIERGLMSE